MKRGKTLEWPDCNHDWPGFIRRPGKKDLVSVEVELSAELPEFWHHLLNDSVERLFSEERVFSSVVPHDCYRDLHPDIPGK